MLDLLNPKDKLQQSPQRFFCDFLLGDLFFLDPFGSSGIYDGVSIWCLGDPRMEPLYYIKFLFAEYHRDTDSDKHSD